MLLISKLQLELADLKVQGSVKSSAPDFVNAASKLWQMRSARAVTEFTKPGAQLLAKPFIMSIGYS